MNIRTSNVKLNSDNRKRNSDNRKRGYIMDTIDLGREVDTINEARKTQGMTIRELSDASGVPLATVQRILSHTAKNQPPGNRLPTGRPGPDTAGGGAAEAAGRRRRQGRAAHSPLPLPAGAPAPGLRDPPKRPSPGEPPPGGPLPPPLLPPGNYYRGPRGPDHRRPPL